MISCSEAYKAKINNGDVPLVRMQLISANGRTIWLEDGQFWGNSISFNDATSQDGAFTVGSAIIGSFGFGLNNFDRSLDSIVFEGATVIPFLYFDIDGTNEYLPKGVFYVTTHTTSGNIIRGQAMDGLKLLDQSRTTITYPTTVQALVTAICTANNITLDTVTIPHGNFVLNAPTDASGENMVLTDRQMLSYACECIGCYARMNELGHLVIGWYDFEKPVNLATTFDGKSLWTSPIEVTGIKLTYRKANAEGTLEDVEYLYGTDDRIIKIESNPYITASNYTTVCTNVSSGIFDTEFRPGSLPLLANPCLQAGDVLSVHDRYANYTYLFPVTSTTYTKQLTQTAVCAFESKEDTDLRPTSSYRTNVDVENAIRQAQEADAIARAAHEMAETSGYQPIIISNKGNAFTYDTTAELTAVIYDSEMNEVDPDGNQYIYRWWVTKDGENGKYLNGGKEITIPVSDSLCDYTAGIYFETKPITEGVRPFLLSKRNSIVLTNRSGTPLSVRAAESVTA